MPVTGRLIPPRPPATTSGSGRTIEIYTASRAKMQARALSQVHGHGHAPGNLSNRNVGSAENNRLEAYRRTGVVNRVSLSRAQDLGPCNVHDPQARLSSLHCDLPLLLTWIKAGPALLRHKSTRGRIGASCHELSDDAETSHRGCRFAFDDAGSVGRQAASRRASASRRTGPGCVQLP